MPRFRQKRSNKPQIEHQLPVGVYIRRNGNPDYEMQAVVRSCGKNGQKQPIYVLVSATNFGEIVDEVRIADFNRLYRRV